MIFYPLNRALTSDARLTRIEGARFESTRPRNAGSNARLGDHGLTIRLPLVRLTDSDGVSGFGVARVSSEQAAAWIDRPLAEAFDTEKGEVAAPFLPLEYPLYDLAGQRAQSPVYALWDNAPSDSPLQISCYDTSLYFDDLHLSNNEAAAQLIAQEAHEGYERGHRAFKIKVGRGARHMELEKGTQRDIAVIQAVREAVGPTCPLMIDANNGYNLNLTKKTVFRAKPPTAKSSGWKKRSMKTRYCTAT